MKSTQHAHGGWEANKSRGSCDVLRKLMEKDGTKTQNTKQMLWLQFLLQEKTTSLLIGIPSIILQ